MIRFVFRFVGLLVLAAGFIALVYDGTKSIAGNQIFITKLNVAWDALHPTSLQMLRSAAERHGAAWLWPPVQVVLEQPAWLVLGIIGAILILLGRKKPPLIGYARR
jgi:hypothetical protein